MLLARSIRRKRSLYLCTPALRSDTSASDRGSGRPVLRRFLDPADLCGDRPVVAVQADEPRRPLLRLFLRLRLDDGVAADDLLGLSERAVHHRELAAVPAHLLGLRGAREAGDLDLYSGFSQLF